MARPKIRIENRHARYCLDEPLLRRIIARILERMPRTTSVELGIVLVSDPEIRVLNRRYKRHDRATDVLSFPLDGTECGVQGLLGEIAVSIDRAKAQAVTFRTRFDEELVRYVVHGILHLFGYDDLTPKDRALMSAEEDRILGWLATTEDLSRVLTPR